MSSADHEFDYQRIIERLTSKDTSTLNLQCAYTVLYGMLYESVKYCLLDKVLDFYSDDFMTLEKSKKSEKYTAEAKEAGGEFKLAYSFYDLKQEQIEIIEKAKERRGKVTHEFLNFFLAGEHLTPEEIKDFLNVAKYLDNFYIVNIEIAVSGEVDTETADLENAHSLGFLLMEKLAEKIFII